MQQTMKTADDFADKGGVWNYVVTMAASAVFVIMYFCGSRARQEVADVIVKDFTVLHPSLIVYEHFCDSKNRHRNSDYSFVERESSFIVVEYFCRPIHFFLDKRPPDACDKSTYRWQHSEMQEKKHWH